MSQFVTSVSEDSFSSGGDVTGASGSGTIDSGTSGEVILPEEYHGAYIKVLSDRSIVRLKLPPPCGLAAEEMFQKIQGQVAINAILKYEEKGELNSLRSLHKRGLGDVGAEIVARFIETDTPLNSLRAKGYVKTIGLAGNGIGSDGARALARAFSSRSPRAVALKSIEVYSNCKGPFWGSFAGQILAHNPSVTNIDLGGNNIGDVGVCSMLAQASTWIASRAGVPLTLHLDYCGLTDSGASLLKKSIPNAQLWLQGNAVSKMYLRPPVPTPMHDNEILGLLKLSALNLMEHETAHREMYDINQSSSSDSFPDAVASMTLKLCERQCSDFMKGIVGQWTIASFVQEDTSTKTCRIVSWGMGTKFLNSQVAKNCDDLLVKDSHAEVLARRALKKYFCSHLLAFGSPPTGEHIKYHLYTSTAPCVSSKGHTGSCSEKILGWCKEGIMGKGPYGTFFGFVPLSSMIIGKKYKKKIVDKFAEYCPAIRPTKIRLEHLTRANNTTRGDTDESRAFYIGGKSSLREKRATRSAPIDKGMYFAHDGRTGMELDGAMSPLCSYVLHREQELAELEWDANQAKLRYQRD
jgi:hypothetical protein